MKKFIVCSLLMMGALCVNARTIIRTNQLGYLPNSKKVAVVMTGDSGRWQYSRYDFSDMTEEGWHQLTIDGVKSDSFLISWHVYDNLADFPLNYMRQQRCGWNPFMGDSCHWKDGIIIYHPTKSGQHLDVRGGWHDASDCLQYTTTTANAIYQMMLAYELYPGQFADEYKTDGTPGKNGIPDIVDEIHWGLEWLNRMNPAPDEFYNQLADDRDHRGMRRPHDDVADYGYGVNNGRPVYFVTGEPQQQGPIRAGVDTLPLNITTGAASIAGKYASCFALGAKILSQFEEYKGLADEITNKAMNAYALGVSKPGFCQTASVVSPYIYEESNWVDDMELGAYELYRKTNDGYYLIEAAKYGRQEPTTPWMGTDTARHYQWYPFMNIGHYRLATCKDKRIRQEFIAYMKLGIDSVYKFAMRNIPAEKVTYPKKNKDVNRGFLYGIPNIWCSNNLTTAMWTQCILYRQLSGDTQYVEMENALRDWLMGCNPWGVCMIVQLPGSRRYPTQPHSFLIYDRKNMLDYNEHLQRSDGTVGGILNTTGGLVDGPVYMNIFKGLLGIRTDGGINYMDVQPKRMVYHDSTHDYSTNEPTMDGTACLTFPFAALAAEAAQAQSK